MKRLLQTACGSPVGELRQTWAPPGGPGVKGSGVSAARGPGLILGQGTMTLQAVQQGEKQTAALD